MSNIFICFVNYTPYFALFVHQWAFVANTCTFIPKCTRIKISNGYLSTSKIPQKVNLVN